MAVAAVPAAIGGLLAIDIAETVLVQIVGQLVAATLAAVLAPELEGLQVDAYGTIDQRLGSPPTPLPAAQAAQAVIRGYWNQQQGAAEAKFTGYNPERFKVMTDTAGQPLPLLTLAEAWRRGFIPKSGRGADSVSLEQGIRESDLKDKWLEVVEKLQYQLPPIGVIIEGWLRAQISPEQALKLADQAGVDKETATLMFKAAGRPPGPQELLELWRRGVIPEEPTGGDTLSLHQGYLETDLKDKWYPAWKELYRYVPPPRTVTAMVREGAFTDAQALAYYKDAGLDDKLAAAYLEAAHHQRTAATKELAKGDILALLMDELIDEPAALADLEALGYAPETAKFEVEIARARAEHALLNQVLTRLRTLYVAHKLDKQQALEALTALGLSPTARDKQLGYWDQARANNVAVLTPAQIGEAVKLGWLDATEGLGLLQGHGYSPADATLYLVVHLKLAPGDRWPDGSPIMAP